MCRAMPKKVPDLVDLIKEDRRTSWKSVDDAYFGRGGAEPDFDYVERLERERGGEFKDVGVRTAPCGCPDCVSLRLDEGANAAALRRYKEAGGWK